MQTLYLIRVRLLNIEVVVEGAEFGNPRKRLRGEFVYNKVSYRLAVTDSSMEAKYRQRSEGSYTLEDVIICVSLGEPYQGYAYKLVAGVITH